MIVFYINMNKIQPSTLIEGYESEEVKKFAQRGDGNMNKLLIDQTADLRNKIDTYKEKYNNPMMDLENGVFDEFKITFSNTSTDNNYTFDLTDDQLQVERKTSNGAYVPWISANQGKVKFDDFKTNPEKYYIELITKSFDLKVYDELDVASSRMYADIKKYSSLRVDNPHIILDNYTSEQGDIQPSIRFKIHKIKDAHLKKYHYTGPHVTIGDSDKNSLANALLEDTNVYIQQNEQIFALGALTIAILSVGSYVIFRK